MTSQNIMKGRKAQDKKMVDRASKRRNRYDGVLHRANRIFAICRSCAVRMRWPRPRRQSEFRELALTGRYCRVHLASVRLGCRRPDMSP